MEETLKEKWKCEDCDSLLGKRRGNEIEIRYKGIQYSVEGEDLNIATVCRNCGKLNRILIRGDANSLMRRP
jgi:RNase P subunit RPR2